MDCPCCGLVNPQTAKRCDCGYDFETRTVERSYAPQALPKEVKILLAIIGIFNAVGLTVAVSTGHTLRGVAVLAWSLALWVLYRKLVEGSNGARIGLAILTFPLRTAFFLWEETRLYCRQAHARDGRPGE